MPVVWIVAVLSLVSAIEPSPSAGGSTSDRPKPPAAAPANEDFVSLFNGLDLAGWRIVDGKEDAFKIREGVLEFTTLGGYPTWLCSERTYENYVLRLEYKGPKHSQTGLLLHAPPHGKAGDVGIRIQLGDDVADGAKALPSGSITGVRHASVIATGDFNRWNTVEVLVDWPVLQVRINDQLVQDVNCAADQELRYRHRVGYIGFQDLGTRLSLRNIRIRELPPREESQWLSLFNGRDLTGWKIIGSPCWEVEDGVLHGRTTGTGYLVSEREFENFELRAYVRTSRHANSGIFYRWKSLVPPDRGYEVQILNIPDVSNPTGSIYGHMRADPLAATDGAWFPIQIIAEGPQTVVRVNGKTCTVAENLAIVRPGAIALQMHDRRSAIEFKDIRIRPLP